MQRHGKDQLGRPFELAPGPFHLLVHVHVRRNLVQQEQKADADQESHGCGDKGQLTHVLAALQSRLQQTPKGRRHHDARRETGQYLLQALGDLFFQTKDHSGAKAGPQKGNHDAAKNYTFHKHPQSSSMERYSP